MTIPPPDAGEPSAGEPSAPIDYPAGYPDPPPVYPPPPAYPPPGYPPPGYPHAAGYPPPQGYPPGSQHQPYPGYYPDSYAPYRSAAPVGTNGLATASLILSLGGAFTSLLCFVGAIFVIAGIVVGIVALNQIKHTHQDGRGMAIAGIAVGAVVLVIFAVLIGLIMLLGKGTIDYSLV